MSANSAENRLRRAAKRQGLELHKFRARDPRSQWYGKWYFTCDPKEGVKSEWSDYWYLNDEPVRFEAEFVMEPQS